jgi:D-alanine-D-alanine ligase
LKFPLFVKPTSMGGGEGVDKNSVVHNFADLRTKSTALATDLASDSLVEEYLSGREFSVAILEAKLTNEPLAMPLEIVTASNSRGDRILSQAVKADNHESVLPVTDPLIRAKLTTMAMDVFFALGATGYGRIDIRLDSHGVPHFLEANLIPSLIDTYGNFPKACILNIGLGYDDMLLRIVDLGFANQPRAHSALLAA